MARRRLRRIKTGGWPGSARTLDHFLLSLHVSRNHSQPPAAARGRSTEARLDFPDSNSSGHSDWISKVVAPPPPRAPGRRARPPEGERAAAQRPRDDALSVPNHCGVCQ
jgi:hypothetical protein